MAAHRRLSDPQTVLALAAAAVTIALTAAAFWLSYEHLHDLATAHGLGHSTARAWVWPATVDMFIGIGELLVLRGSLAGRVDWFAIILTSIGSGGSIALNVAAVGGNVALLDYVVAAIPPSAALLAFAALMRQIHDHLAHRVPAAVPAPADTGYTDDQTYPGPYPHPLTGLAEDAAQWAPVPVAPLPVPAMYPHPDQHRWDTRRNGVPAAVPAASTRVHVRADYVPDDAPIEPDPDPDPAAGTPDEDLAQQLRDAYPGYQGSGRTPSIRAIRADLGIGQARAQRIQRLLTEGASL